GSPFNTSSMLRGKLIGKQVKVLAGVNMAMMVEAVFARGIMDLDALAQDLLNAGPEGIRDLDQLESAKDPEFEDGI
ncbi:MAG TPA: PTS sugar transporter subunit IIA, partial [Candidatus Caccovicinus merdipullorum]|nr:PTS sugar transporter subunit IIA [Candidatus Caccovicinus merdipullorum]